MGRPCSGPKPISPMASAGPRSPRGFPPPAQTIRRCSMSASTAERHADHIDEAAKLMLSAPRDRGKAGEPGRLVDGAPAGRAQAARRRRILLRAYRICAEHSWRLPTRRGWRRNFMPAGSPCASLTIPLWPRRISTPWRCWRIRRTPSPAPPIGVAASPRRRARTASRFTRGPRRSRKPFMARSRARKLGDEAVALRAPAAAAEGERSRRTGARCRIAVHSWRNGVGAAIGARQRPCADTSRSRWRRLSRLIEEKGDARIALAAARRR